MAKAEISWKRADEGGSRLQVTARRSGDHWNFFIRARRYERWEPLKHPPLEDWLALLDSLERRVARRQYVEEDVTRLKSWIRRNFPEVVL